jgi:hypothetical protein
MKIENHPPTQAPFLTYDGATGDYYLRLVGAGAKMLREHTPITPVIPISPFDLQKSYKLKNRASGLMLNVSGTAITQSADAASTNLNWQLIFDGSGYFKIKSRQSGNVISAGSAAGGLSQSADSNADNAKWHLEWDGTGCCRIINKATGKTIGSSADGSAVQTMADAGLDNLRWQVLPQ